MTATDTMAAAPPGVQRPPHRSSDASIVLRSLDEPHAFEELFDRHWPALHGFCCSRAGAAGEDIAAETFRLAFGKRRHYRAEYADARPWLFGIASRLLAHHLRDGRRGRAALARSAGMLREDAHPDALTELERQMLGPRLSEALGECTAAEREALLLWAWADLEYVEIARVLDVPLGTVRSRLHRARRRVRTHLDEGTDHDER